MVEGACLENRYTGNRIVSSNLTPTAVTILYRLNPWSRGHSATYRLKGIYGAHAPNPEEGISGGDILKPLLYNEFMLPQVKSYIVYFLTGGIFTVLIVALEENGSRLLSGFATLIPIFTLIAYIFIGESKGGGAVGQHAWFVLVGTLVSWIPYMIVVAILAPRVGSRPAIVAGLATFFILAAIYLGIVYRYHLFGET